MGIDQTQVEFLLRGLLFGAFGGVVRFVYIYSLFTREWRGAAYKGFMYALLGGFSGIIAVLLNALISGLYAELLLALGSGYAFSFAIDTSLSAIGMNSAGLLAKIEDMRESAAS